VIKHVKLQGSKLCCEGAVLIYDPVIRLFYTECPVTLCQYFKFLFQRPFSFRNIIMDVVPILNGYGDMGISNVA
jgi:hypothetical protein